MGLDHDTAQFAQATIECWWRRMGRRVRPDGATRLLITADGGGSNGSRNRLWKLGLQHLADKMGLEIFGLPFSSRDEQMEQDRAPDVLPHYGELAMASADEPGGHHRI